jgi:hypothetical protein
MNGKPGDDPAIDIIHHGRSVYSPEVDGLVRELAKLMDFRKLQELLYSFAGLPVAEVGAKLRETVARLKREARARGWEIE